MRPRSLLAFAASIAVLVGGWLAIDATAQRAPSMPNAASAPVELDAFERRVRDYLLDHPEVIMEALQILQERQRVAEAERLRQTIAAHRDETLNDPDSPVGGNPSGDVTVVEFFDYNCPYCRQVAPTMKELEREPTPTCGWSTRSSRSSGRAPSSRPARPSRRTSRAGTSRSTGP